MLLVFLGCSGELGNVGYLLFYIEVRGLAVWGMRRTTPDPQCTPGSSLLHGTWPNSHFSLCFTLPTSDNYGFVTYRYAEEAFAAIESGHKLRQADEQPFDQIGRAHV